MIRYASLAFMLLLATPVFAEDELKAVWTIDKELANPESAYLDPETKVLFVSNVNGSPVDKDGNGFISKLTTDGKIIKAKWFEGLNAPKGLRSADGVLWVSDIDEVVGITIADGKLFKRIKIDGAKFLNDVAAGPDGTIYVSDMAASKVYAITDGKATIFAEGEQLESPNGLLVDGDQLLIAAWGYAENLDPKILGRLLTLDLKSKKVAAITTPPQGNLDGLELDGHGGYYVTDWKAGKVFQFTHRGTPRIIAEFKQGTADIAYLPKEQLLIIPHMLENKLVAYRR